MNSRRLTGPNGGPSTHLAHAKVDAVDLRNFQMPGHPKQHPFLKDFLKLLSAPLER
jgi:hypothetical protein